MWKPDFDHQDGPQFINSYCMVTTSCWRRVSETVEECHRGFNGRGRKLKSIWGDGVFLPCRTPDQESGPVVSRREMLSMPFELLACLLCSSRKSRQLVLPSSFSPCPTPLTLVRCFQVTSGVLLALRCHSQVKSASPLTPPRSGFSPCPTPVLAVPALAAAVHACDVLLVSAGSLLHPPGLHDLHPLTCFLLVPDFALVLITLSCPCQLSDPLGTRFYCLDNPRSLIWKDLQLDEDL